MQTTAPFVVKSTRFSTWTEQPKVVNKEKENTKEEELTKEEKDFMEKYGEVEFVKAFQKCPICKAKIMNTGGCISCPNGCWSKCD